MLSWVFDHHHIKHLKLFQCTRILPSVLNCGTGLRSDPHVGHAVETCIPFPSNPAMPFASISIRRKLNSPQFRECNAQTMHHAVLTTYKPVPTPFPSFKTRLSMQSTLVSLPQHLRVSQILDEACLLGLPRYKSAPPPQRARRSIGRARPDCHPFRPWFLWC